MFVSVRSRLLNGRVSVVKHGIQKYSSSAVEEGKSEEVKYPPILDLSWRERCKRWRQAWYDEIEKVGTVEERMIKVNMPRYYGWKVQLYEEEKIPYDSLRQAQHSTRTHVIKTPGLPSYYDNLVSSDELDSIVQAVRKPIEDAIIFEHISRQRRHQLKEEELESQKQMEDIIANAVIPQIHRILSINLASKLPHMIESEMEIQPRIESFWCVGGIYPSEKARKCKVSLRLKEYANDDRDVWVQYLGRPMCHLRHPHPLQPILQLSECEDPELEVPVFKYDPRTIGYRAARRHITCIPGFWPGDECEFGWLSYHNRGHLHTNPYSMIDEYEVLTTQALLASFSWLNAQAFYQGFSTFHDVTYPLVSQAVVTNGQRWSFYAYQLNTTLIHSENYCKNPMRNICWATEPIKLYDEIENEKIHGFNDEVLNRIIRMYMNSPRERTSVNMKPTFKLPSCTVAELPTDARREWLEQHFKHLVANRPKHRRIPEVYAWQKIFMIDNKCRPQERRLEPWQKGIRVYHRRLDDHAPRYIPRKHRDPRGKRRKVGRFAPTFYP